MHFPITNTNPLSHSFLVRKKPIVYNILFIWWWTYMPVWHTLHEMGARDTLSIWWDLHTLLVSDLKDILCVCVVDFKFFFFFLWEFQPIASTPDDSSFITKPRHQSVFGVDRDWTLDLLYNHQRFYQLSWLTPTSFFFFNCIKFRLIMFTPNNCP